MSNQKVIKGKKITYERNPDGNGGKWKVTDKAVTINTDFMAIVEEFEHDGESYTRATTPDGEAVFFKPE